MIKKIKKNYAYGASISKKNMVVPMGYVIKYTRSKKKQKGLFTDNGCPLRKGDVIGEFLGKNITVEKFNKNPYMNDKVHEVRKHSRPYFILDGRNKKNSSFVNVCNAPKHKRSANAKFVQWKQRIFLKAIKNIKPKEEILAWYGWMTEELVPFRV